MKSESKKAVQLSAVEPDLETVKIVVPEEAPVDNLPAALESSSTAQANIAPAERESPEAASPPAKKLCGSTSGDPRPWSSDTHLSSTLYRADFSRAFNFLPNGKQLFNSVYFLLSAAAVGIVCQTWNVPLLWPLFFMFAIFSFVGFVFSINNRAHPDDFSISLSPQQRRLLRKGALLLPIPFFVIAAALIPANWELQQGKELADNEKYPEAISHLSLAKTLNPMSEAAFATLACCYNNTFEYDKTLASAEAALRLNANDGDVWADKAWALNSTERFAEALPAAQNAVKFSPENGQGFETLSEAYLNLGEYALALAPANTHIQLHNEESLAYELRANILDQLGRSDEAALDRTQAQTLNASEAAASADSPAVESTAPDAATGDGTAPELAPAEAPESTTPATTVPPPPPN